MKKIKKVDTRAAQSILSFACPCIGTCGSCASCGCIGGTSLSQSAYEGARLAITLQAQYGTQFANYS